MFQRKHNKFEQLSPGVHRLCIVRLLGTLPHSALPGCLAHLQPRLLPLHVHLAHLSRHFIWGPWIIPHFKKFSGKPRYLTVFKHSTTLWLKVFNKVCLSKNNLYRYLANAAFLSKSIFAAKIQYKNKNMKNWKLAVLSGMKQLHFNKALQRTLSRSTVRTAKTVSGKTFSRVCST